MDVSSKQVSQIMFWSHWCPDPTSSVMLVVMNSCTLDQCWMDRFDSTIWYLAGYPRLTMVFEAPRNMAFKHSMGMIDDGLIDDFRVAYHNFSDFWDSWIGIGVFFMAPNGYGPRLVSISCRFSSIEVSRFRAAQDSLPRGCPVSGHCDGQSITTTKSPFPYVFFFFFP